MLASLARRNVTLAIEAMSIPGASKDFFEDESLGNSLYLTGAQLITSSVSTTFTFLTGENEPCAVGEQ